MFLWQRLGKELVREMFGVMFLWQTLGINTRRPNPKDVRNDHIHLHSHEREFRAMGGGDFIDPTKR